MVIIINRYNACIYKFYLSTIIGGSTSLILDALHDIGEYFLSILFYCHKKQNRIITNYYSHGHKGKSCGARLITAPQLYLFYF